MTRKSSRRGDRREERPPREGARAQTKPRDKPARPAPATAGKPDERPPRTSHARQSRRDPGFVRIYGFHAVIAALRAPRRGLIRLYATAAAAERLAGEIATRGVETKVVAPEDIAARTPRDAVHQGVLLEARALEPIDISEVPARGLVLVLDQITDPHNVGAILRTAAAFSVDALVTTERHSPEFTGALTKSASGGLEFVPICAVVNLARALEELGDLGYWRVGLDSEASEIFASAPLTRPLALVLGSEDRGLRRLTRGRCDAMARLDLPGAIKSLNVSNACAIALALAREKFARGEQPAPAI